MLFCLYSTALLLIWQRLADRLSATGDTQAGGIRSRAAEARHGPLAAALIHQGPRWGLLSHRPLIQRKRACHRACCSEPCWPAWVRSAGWMHGQDAGTAQAIARVLRRRSRRRGGRGRACAHRRSLASLWCLMRPRASARIMCQFIDMNVSDVVSCRGVLAAREGRLWVIAQAHGRRGKAETYIC